MGSESICTQAFQWGQKWLRYVHCCFSLSNCHQPINSGSKCLLSLSVSHACEPSMCARKIGMQHTWHLNYVQGPNHHYKNMSFPPLAFITLLLLAAKLSMHSWKELELCHDLQIYIIESTTTQSFNFCNFLPHSTFSYQFGSVFLTLLAVVSLADNQINADS